MDYGKQTGAPGDIPNRHDMHVKHTHTSIERLSPRRLLVASALNVGFAITELAGGLLSNSLALLSDSVHNLKIHLWVPPPRDSHGAMQRGSAAGRLPIYLYRSLQAHT